jgi:gliding motility-associated-like protein
MKAVFIGGTKPYKSYEWSTTPVQRTPLATGLAAGSYTFTLTDAHDCQAIKTGIVSQPDEFSLYVREQKHITCYGSNDGLLSIGTKGGTADFAYAWNTTPSRKTAIIDNLLPNAMYSVTATDLNGCTATISAEIKEPEQLLFDQVLPDPVSCPGYKDGSIFVRAQGGTISFDKLYEYSVDGVTFNAGGTFTGLDKGKYTVWIRDNNGCTNRLEQTITEQEPLFVTIDPKDTIIELSKTAELVSKLKTAATTMPKINGYAWYPPEGLSCIDCPSPTVSAYEPRTYRLTVDYGRNCKAKAEAIVRVKPPKDFFVPNAFTPGNYDQIGVNDVFKVYGTAVKRVSMMVFNRWGEKLYESHNMEEGWDGRYKGEMQVPGVYTYTIEIEYLNGDKNSKKGSVMLIR